MFEKEAEDKAFEKYPLSDRCDRIDLERNFKYEEGFQDGAEFGYNKAKEEVEDSYRESLCNSELNLASVTEQLEELEKANEWHYVKDGDLPKEKGNYLVAWKRTHHIEEFGEWGFDVDLFNADEGYFEGVGDYVIAWKEIVPPKESE